MWLQLTVGIFERDSLRRVIVGLRAADLGHAPSAARVDEGAQLNVGGSTIVQRSHNMREYDAGVLIARRRIAHLAAAPTLLLFWTGVRVVGRELFVGIFAHS